MIEKAQILQENEYIVYSIINKYTYYFDKEDLYQVGMIGLINALNNYKQEKNAKFSSYAYLYVKGEVTKYIRESSVLKISKELVKVNSSVTKAREYLTQKMGYTPTTEELALFLEIDIKKIEEAEEATRLVTSLDNEEENEIYNYYGYEEKSYKEELLDLKNELENLSEFDKNLIEKRYNEGLTQSELSKELGINQVKISRYEKEILTKLRRRLM